MAAIDDPRPVLRQELVRVFQNPRVIRAFEGLFDLAPPQFVNQQIQIDEVNLSAEFASSVAIDAIAAISRLADAIELVGLMPPIDQLPSVIGLDTLPALDQGIVPTWTGLHSFSGTGPRVSIIGAGTASSQFTIVSTGGSLVLATDGSGGGSIISGSSAYAAILTTLNATSAIIGTNSVARIVVDSTGHVSINAPTGGQTLTLAPSPAAGELIATSGALTTGAGAALGTLTNAPSAGNPTKWIKINDNGTVRSVPAW